MKKFAFTLAETLIVMGIIGVVAALTLPNLSSSTGEKEKVAKVKKIYQNLEDAVGRAQAVYGPIDEWCTNYSGNCQNRNFDRITEFLKVSKICNSVSQCSITIHTVSEGTSFSNAAILADGTSIGLSNRLDNYIAFDIDGPNKGANSPGRDVFGLYYSKNGLCYHDYADKEYAELGNNSKATSWVLKFDNMDYLKTTDGTTCPDGKKLTFGGNHSCK